MPCLPGISILSSSLSSLSSEALLIVDNLDSAIGAHERLIAEAEEVHAELRRARAAHKWLVTAERAGKEADPISAARLVRECSECEAEVAESEVVAEHQPSLRALADRLKDSSLAAVAKGAEDRDASRVGDALLVLYYLSSIDSVSVVLDRLVLKASQCLAAALDVSSYDQPAGPGGRGGTGAGGGFPSGSGSSTPGSVRGSNPAGGQSAAWRTMLWGKVEEALKVVHGLCAQAWLVSRVSLRKRDPQTYLPLRSEKEDLSAAFWTQLCGALAKQLARSAQASSFVGSTLTNEFPRLLVIAKDFADQVALTCGADAAAPASLSSLPTPASPSVTAIAASTEGGALSASQRQELMGSLSRFETAFLAAALSRVSGPVKALLDGAQAAVAGEAQLAAQGGSGSGGSGVSFDVAGVISAMQSELHGARSEAGLALQVAGAVAKAANMLAAGAEMARVNTAEAVQLVRSSQATPAQRTNANLHNALRQVAAALRGPVGGGLGQQVSAALETPAQALDAAASAISQAVLSALVGVARQVYASELHSEDFSGATPPAPPPSSSQSLSSSLYMRSLQKVVAHAYSKVLARYTPCDPLTEQCRETARSIIRLYVANVALVRPVGEGGRLALASDMAQMELVVGTLAKIDTLGASYRELRALRPLIFMEPAEVLAAAEAKRAGGGGGPGSLDPDLRVSTVLHSLFARAPRQIQSPFTSKGWTQHKYIAWLDQNGDAAAWPVVKACLEAYAKSVHAQGLKEYDPLYPIILKIGEALCPSTSA
jgi:hypothetical protein